MMETYHGHVRTPADAIILFEACRIGLLPRVQRRLSEKERQSIKSGSVFVWDEREAGMRRWTDGKSWSASRVAGSFLTYREMEGKRGGGFDKGQNRDSAHDPDSDGGPDGYRYKADGLLKQSFSITTNNGQHLHLISYFSRSSAAAQNLVQPSSDPQLRHIRPEKGMYPESTVHEQSSIPAITRGPMSSPAYTNSPHQPYGQPGPYAYAPHPSWAPPSPMHTPPQHYSPYTYQNHSPHASQQHSSSLQHLQYPPHLQYGPPPPPTVLDRPPPHVQHSALPPPPPPYHSVPTSYPTQYSSAYQHGYGPYPHPTHAPHTQPPSQYPPPSHQAPPPYQAMRGPHPDMSVHRLESEEKARPGFSAQRQQASRNDEKPPPGLQTAPVAPPQPTSGQTIPSISAMLNGDENDARSVRGSSRSPNGAARTGPSDIPTHKLGFEASRDMEALRNLDKTTFKGY